MSWKAAAAPWNANYTEDGAEISFNLKLQEHYVDGLGTVDMRMVSVEAIAKATPVGPTAAQILTAANPSGALGAAGTGAGGTAGSGADGGAGARLIVDNYRWA
jgi:hypothetical protein